MSEQGWLKREMEIVQCEVATWPSWKRGEGMDDVKRYKLLQDVRYDDGAFVIPAGQVVIREADYDVLRDERDRLAELVRQAQPHVCSLLCPSVKARHELWTHTKLCLNMQAALTPAGGGRIE